MYVVTNKKLDLCDDGGIDYILRNIHLSQKNEERIRHKPFMQYIWEKTSLNGFNIYKCDNCKDKWQKRYSSNVDMNLSCNGESSLTPFFRTITDAPAISSKGFSNTFRLLEMQLKNNKSRTRFILETHQPKIRIVKVSKEPNLQLKSCLDLELDVIDRLRTLSEDDFSIHYIRKLTIGNEETLIHLFTIRATSLFFYLYNFLTRSKCKSQRLTDHSEIVFYLEVLHHHYIGDMNELKAVPEGKAYILNDDSSLKYYAGYTINGKRCLRVIKNIKHVQNEGKMCLLLIYIYTSTYIYI